MHHRGTRVSEEDEDTASRLEADGLLQIVDLNTFVDCRGVKAVANALRDLIASGSLDELAARQTEFQALAYSQLGCMSDGRLAENQELHARGIGSQGAAGPLHPVVQSLLLVILAQFFQPAGRKQGMYLCPETDRRELHGALTEVIGNFRGPYGVARHATGGCRPERRTDRRGARLQGRGP